MTTATNAVPAVIGEDVEKYDLEWKWIKDTPPVRGHWISSKEARVMVFPPTDEDPAWYIYTVGGRSQKFAGDNVEERAFSCAEMFTKQP